MFKHIFHLYLLSLGDDADVNTLITEDAESCYKKISVILPLVLLLCLLLLAMMMSFYFCHRLTDGKQEPYGHSNPTFKS